MYSELAHNEEEIKEVLENLCSDTVIELKMFINSYKEEIFEAIKKLSVSYVIKLKENNKPVGLFGLIPQHTANGKKAAGIFLLTTDELHKGNILTFLKGAKKQVEKWCSEYDLIMDKCCKHNQTIIKWLKLLGFSPSKFQDDDFQIYYRGKIELYRN